MGSTSSGAERDSDGDALLAGGEEDELEEGWEDRAAPPHLLSGTPLPNTQANLEAWCQHKFADLEGQITQMGDALNQVQQAQVQQTSEFAAARTQQIACNNKTDSNQEQMLAMLNMLMESQGLDPRNAKQPRTG